MIEGKGELEGTVDGYKFTAVWIFEIVDGKQYSGFDEFWIDGIDYDDEEAIYDNMRDKVWSLITNNR